MSRSLAHTLKSLAVAVVLYVFPLLGAWDRLADPRWAVCVFAIFLLELFQPALVAAQGDTRSDSGSMFVLSATALASQVLPIVEFRFGAQRPIDPALVALGLLLIVGGGLLRVWSIRVLGRFFTARVEIAPDHRLVRDGPYALLRHPSYAGAVLALVGIPILLQQPLSAALCVLLLAIGYGYRIPVEEARLERHFGDEFKQYRAATKRLVPFIW